MLNSILKWLSTVDIMLSPPPINSPRFFTRIWPEVLIWHEVPPLLSEKFSRPILRKNENCKESWNYVKSTLPFLLENICSSRNHAKTPLPFFSSGWGGEGFNLLTLNLAWATTRYPPNWGCFWGYPPQNEGDNNRKGGCFLSYRPHIFDWGNNFLYEYLSTSYSSKIEFFAKYCPRKQNILVFFLK